MATFSPLDAARYLSLEGVWLRWLAFVAHVSCLRLHCFPRRTMMITCCAWDKGKLKPLFDCRAAAGGSALSVC